MLELLPAGLLQPPTASAQPAATAALNLETLKNSEFEGEGGTDSDWAQVCQVWFFFTAEPRARKSGFFFFYYLEESGLFPRAKLGCFTPICSVRLQLLLQWMLLS